MVSFILSEADLLEMTPEWIVLVFGRTDDVSVYLCAVGVEAAQTLLIPRRLDLDYMWQLARHYGLDRRLKAWIESLPSSMSQDFLIDGCQPIDIAEYLDADRNFVYVLRPAEQPIYKVLDYTDTVEWNFEPKPLGGVHL